ncbi:MAG: ferredoxin [Roseococcus sp.]|nr:ferredoxin [Roseococcus sp.]
MPYVILTSKPGQFRTEPGPGMRPVEGWDYFFCGRMRAHFLIAELDRPTKVRVVDEEGPINPVPSKFLPSFESLEAARAELRSLVSFGSMPVELRPAAAA